MYSETRIIREFILSFDKPFNLADLYYGLRTEYGILNRVHIKDMLDELCESGVVECNEIENDVWAFEVCA